MSILKSIKAKKSLGQNFLIDKNISKKIVALLHTEFDELVLEIGPGTGALTNFLLEKPIHLYAVECDERAVESLSNQFPKAKFPNFNLIHQDILKFDLEQLFLEKKKKIKVIGNIPYFLSSGILFYLYANSTFIEKAVIMLQKEFAERLLAVPRTKEYGIITVANELVAEASFCFNVSNNCFYPKPKVSSTIIEINFFENPPATQNFNDVLKIVKLAFNQRRKTLKNSLSSVLKDNPFSTLNYEKLQKFLTKRPEELRKDEFIELASLIYHKENDDKQI
ncbi:MAG: ribosomal RNA small subunit methyltransferase A [Ignavibacteria bacterium]|nr:ribosomal RNA small subunit methyltransferase A [Ignavibacteria bacterium]